MKSMGLRSLIRKKRYNHAYETGLVTHENILNRQFKAKAPGEKLVSDITFLNVSGKRMYLSIIMDLYNNEIVAYYLSDRYNTDLTFKPLLAYLAKNTNVAGTIFHSDQGCQYASKAFSDKLSGLGIIQSMSRQGNPLDNAPAESFFSHFKCEAIYINEFNTPQELHKIVDDYIRFYNHIRPQSNLNNMAPIEYLNSTMSAS